MPTTIKVLGFLVPAAILAGVFLWPNQEDVAAPVTVANITLDLPESPVQVQKGSAPPVPRLVVSDQMRRQFDTTQNYAAFIHDAMQRPSEGGRFYAGLANTRCTTVAALRDENAVLKGDAAVRDTARRRIEDLQRRCSGVLVDRNSQVTFLRNLRYSNSRTSDALMLDRENLGEARDAGDIQGQLIHARQSGDPYLIGLRLEQYGEAFAPLIDPQYAGQAPPSDVFRAATLAALCELADDCIDNLQLQQQCYSSGVCQFRDLRDYLRSQIPQQSWPLFEKTVNALLKIGGKL